MTSDHKYCTLRVHFSEKGKIRFISHRDVARLFERAARIVGLPVAYSEGFSPRPKLSFGLALSVAHESESEYFDVELSNPVSLDGLCGRLSDALPEGLAVHEVALFDKKLTSLQQSITSCMWRIEILGAPAAKVQDAVKQILESPDLPVDRVRKGKSSTVDIRPCILELRVNGETDAGVLLETELAVKPISLRPSELVDVINVVCNEPAGGETSSEFCIEEGQVSRLHQWISVDEARCEPMGPPEASTGQRDQVLSHAS